MRALTIGLATIGVCSQISGCSRESTAGNDQGLPLAVLGDSDSHAYRDTILLPADRRGGEQFHATTYQWTEIIDRFRGSDIDQGDWGAWGTRWRYALLKQLIGKVERVPRKLDFEYNFALSGALCEGLITGRRAQLYPLLDLLSSDPHRWRTGVVLIRIGINNLGSRTALEQFARSGLDGRSYLLLQECLNPIRASVVQIRQTAPDVHIVLAGMFDETDAAPYVDSTFAPDEIRRIRSVLDYYDEQLMELATTYPRVSFLDDRRWWRDVWGTHDESGEPAPGDLIIGDLVITNSIGDHPSNAILADGHAGTVVNAYWANHLIAHLSQITGRPLQQITNAQILQLVTR